MEMIFFVLNDPDYMDEILEGWQKIGVTGVTIFETTGFHRRMKKRIPMRYLFGEQSSLESGNVTLVALVENRQVVEQCLAVVEQVVGDLDQPSTGVFASWPIPFLKGMGKTGLGN